MSNLPRYKPPKTVVHHTKKPGYVPQSHTNIIRALRKMSNGATSLTISKHVPYTQNHCGIILNHMFKKGLVTRERKTRGNVRYYRYFLKEKA